MTEPLHPAENDVDRRCCLDDQRDHTPLGCTRCGCLTPVWIAGLRPTYQPRVIPPEEGAS
jgi:hypothetical protein